MGPSGPSLYGHLLVPGPLSVLVSLHLHLECQVGGVGWGGSCSSQLCSEATDWGEPGAGGSKGQHGHALE